MSIVNRLYTDVKVAQPGTVVIHGRFAVGATGAVGTVHGTGFTVARTGTGAYTITLTARSGVPNILYANVQQIYSAVSPTFTHNLRMLLPTLASATLTIVNYATSTPTEIVENNQVTFEIAVQNLNYVG